MAGRIAALLVVTVAFFGPISAVTVNGPCDSTGFDPYSNFRLGEFIGTWYEMYRYNNAIQQYGECSNVEVYLEANEVNMRLYTSNVVFDPDFHIVDQTMYGKIAHPEAITPVGAFNISSVGVYDQTNLLILDTDYSDWAIAWGCKENGDNTSEHMAWVLSRFYYLRPDVKDLVNTRIDVLLQRALLRETFNDDNYCLGGEISPA